MILFSIGTFGIVLLSGSIRKGEKAIDPDLTWAPMEKRQIMGEREAKPLFVKAKLPSVPTDGYERPVRLGVLSLSPRRYGIFKAGDADRVDAIS